MPTVLTQLACTFLNLITPNGIGGTALQLDYLHKQGVPVASGGSAMVLSTGVGGAIQMALFLGAAAITATAVDTSSSSSRQHEPVDHRRGGGRGRDRAARPEDPGQGRSGRHARGQRHLGGAAQPEEGDAALRRRPRPATSSTRRCSACASSRSTNGSTSRSSSSSRSARAWSATSRRCPGASA